MNYLFLFLVVFVVIFVVKYVVFLFDRKSGGKKPRKEFSFLAQGPNKEEEEKEEEEEEVENTENFTRDWKSFQFRRGGLKFKHPRPLTVTKQVSEPMVLLQVVDPNDASDSLDSTTQTVITIESLRTPTSCEEYWKELSGSMPGSAEIKVVSKGTRKINGNDLFEVFYTIRGFGSVAYAYSLHAYKNNRIFCFQEISQNKLLSKRGILKYLINTVEIDDIEDTGVLSYNGHGFSIQLPTSQGFENIDHTFENTLFYVGKKSQDGKNEEVIRLIEEKGQSVNDLSDLCCAEARRESERNYEEIDVTMFSKKPVMMLSYPSKDKMGTIFVVPFETEDERCFRLKLFSRNKSHAMKSFNSIRYDSKKASNDRQSLTYENILHKFELTLPVEYSCLEYSHNEPIVSFEGVSSKKNKNHVLVTDVHKKAKLGNTDALISTLKDIQNDTHRTFREARKVMELLSEDFVEIGGREFFQFCYAQHTGSPEMVYVFQSTTILLEEEEEEDRLSFFFLRSVSIGVKFEGKILEEAKEIHHSLKLRK